MSFLVPLQQIKGTMTDEIFWKQLSVQTSNGCGGPTESARPAGFVYTVLCNDNKSSEESVVEVIDYYCVIAQFRGAAIDNCNQF